MIETTMVATTTTISTPSPRTPSFTPVTPSPLPTSYSTRTPQPSRTPTPTLDISYLLSSEIEDERIAEVIRLVLTQRVAPTNFSGVPFCSYILLMPLQKNIDGTITAYVKPICNEFFVTDEVLQKGAGDSLPVAIIMEEQTEGWYVEVQKPSIAHWGPSIDEIFPTQTHPFIFSRATIPLEELYQSNIQQAEEYFGLPFKPTPDIPRSATPTTTQTSTPLVRVITVTPTPTLDISALGLEVNRVKVISNQPDILSLIVQLGDTSLNLNLTSFEKGLVSSGWRIFLYQYKEDEDYHPEKALVLDHLQDPQYPQNDIYIEPWFTFLVEITLDDLKNRLGDYRDLVYQIVDENGVVVWQDNLYLFQNLSIPFPVNSRVPFVAGYPNALSEDTEVFVHQDQELFIVVKEPQGGFNSLSYIFNFPADTGITSTTELEKIEDKLTIEIFPYQENGVYSSETSHHLSGTMHAPVYAFQVRFPSQWREEAFSEKNKFYLRILDDEGDIIKEEYFEFVPYTP